jgi:predicted GH43/DUF377 family glycosyl hydrolase
LYANKDAVFFPEPVPGPDGRPTYAMLHRPMWDLGWIREGEEAHLPAGIADDRPSIWISYAAADDVERDVTALVHLRDHRLVALPEFAFESIKIGAGPPPIRVDEGWLLVHHGASGKLIQHWGPQQSLIYAAGAMLLDPADPVRVIARTPEPLLAPETEYERSGLVPNVVFPTAIEQIHRVQYVFYGMADSRIGLARLDRLTSS